MIYALAFVAVCLLIATAGGFLVRREFHPATKRTTDVRLFCAAVVDLARVLAEHARHVTVATVREMWGEPTGQHRAGWGPSTLQQVAPRRVAGVDFGPAATVVPQAVRFPDDTQEFAVTFGTVEIGQAA